MPIQFEDYYKTLGVARDAAADEVKRAYRKLAQQWHPDRNKEAEAAEKFSKVNEAYEVLKDPEKRKKYDELGAHWKEGQEFRPPPGYGGFGGGRGGGGRGQSFEFEGQDLSDFFREVFGRHASAGNGRRGATSGAGGGPGPGGGFEDLFGGGGGLRPVNPPSSRPRSPSAPTRPTTAPRASSACRPPPAPRPSTSKSPPASSPGARSASRANTSSSRSTSPTTRGSAATGTT